MKKIIKSRIFLVIITMIICISGTLYAASTYKASDVVYNASDGTSTNVESALNDLYNNQNSLKQIKVYGYKVTGNSDGEKFRNAPNLILTLKISNNKVEMISSDLISWGDADVLKAGAPGGIYGGTIFSSATINDV